ncbi:MAG TPA: NAD(P)-dependent oxidoreductase [Steroidobacteraceae bacterium]|nr:NAD(P)-dependent oxidoreductase [Steroidobacteraceae bacterium]
MHAKRVLVTGAGGFIGRWSVPALLRLGYEVHAVLSGKVGREVPEQLQGAKLHFANLLDDLGVDELTRAVRPSHLLHFAWIATPGVYWNSEENFRWLAASERLLRSFRAQGGSRVMMAGTCAEYDWSRVGVCDELSSPLAKANAAIPNSTAAALNHAAAATNDSAAVVTRYAACKIALQTILDDFGRREHLSTAWGRIFFQFGPYEHPDRLVPSVICNLLLNREAPCSHGRQIRSFLHVADVGEAFAAVLDSELEGPVNIGSDERVSLANLVDRIGRQIGRPELLRLGVRPAPPQEPSLLVPAIHRLRDEARWRPRFTLDEALRDTIAWWRGRLLDHDGAARHE